MFVPIVVVLVTSCKTVISIVVLELRNGRYRIWAVGANRLCVRPTVFRCESHEAHVLEACSAEAGSWNTHYMIVDGRER